MVGHLGRGARNWRTSRTQRFSTVVGYAGKPFSQHMWRPDTSEKFDGSSLKIFQVACRKFWCAENWASGHVKYFERAKISSGRVRSGSRRFWGNPEKWHRPVQALFCEVRNIEPSERRKCESGQETGASRIRLSPRHHVHSETGETDHGRYYVVHKGPEWARAAHPPLVDHFPRKKKGRSGMAPARCLKWISLSLGMWTMSRLSTGNTAMIMRTRRTPVGSRTLRVRRLCFRNTDILLTYTIEVSFSWGRPNGRLSWEQNEISDEKKFVFDGTKFFSRLQLYIDSTFWYIQRIFEAKIWFDRLPNIGSLISRAETEW